MHLSDHDQLVLHYLETLEEGSDLPDGCDVKLLAAQGLIFHRATGWVVTDAGKLRLRNLQSVARSDSRLRW